MLKIEAILDACIEKNASDIHISKGRPLTYRIHGRLKPDNDTPLSEEVIKAFIQTITTEQNLTEYKNELCSEFAYEYKDGERFRISLFRQRGSDSIVLRRIPNKIMTFDEIGLPSLVKDLVDKNHGMILVAGPTGSGKSTTLASMINYINRTDDRHIITVEDPIEFVHEQHKSIINQRELGEDTPSFSQALIEALRQDPDTILVGEMRDHDTIQTALMATETGHMVFSTVHTFGATRTIDRIVDVFPSHQQNQIRLQLSTNLIAVISQQLIPRIDQEGRVCVFEFMRLTPAIQNLIRQGQTFKISNEIQTGAKHGMVSVENQLIDLYQRGIISKEDAIFYSLSDDIVHRLESSPANF